MKQKLLLALFQRAGNMTQLIQESSSLRFWHTEDIYFLAGVGCIQPSTEKLNNVIEEIKRCKKKSKVSDVFVFQNEVGQFIVTKEDLRKQKHDSGKKSNVDSGEVESRKSGSDTPTPNK